MSSLKKSLFLVPVLMLALALFAACGGTTPASNPTPAPQAQPTPTQAAPQQPTAAPSAGQQAGEVALPVPSCNKPMKIGVSMLFDDRWLTTMRDAMTAYAKEHPNIELVMVDSKEDVAIQLGQVENFIAQGVDAIVLVPANTDATDPMTKAAQDAGIPLVYVNRKPANLPEGVVYVGSNSIDAGIFQMEWIAEKLGGKGNVVILMGNLSQEAAQQRTAGVKQVAAKYPGIKITKEQTGNWDRAQGMAVMENWLATGDQIDAVASNNDEMAIGALAAIEAAGKLGQIIVGGVDASPDALEEMAKGRLNVTVFQNAKGQGQGGIAAAAALVCGDKIPQITWIPYELVTPENFRSYMNR
ncbi:MAG: substrate-binding domain-containing protein [Caldilineales bacterium]|nr:substrate-binding domain-containing protein [Caldilineales bacterium]MDW8316717.1 substrate-binding domain-containing protein [Anaerolineae bacterium]